MRIVPGKLGLDEIAAIHAGASSLALDPSTRDAVRASADVVQRAASGDEPVYGVNTGFGKLAQTRISAEDLAALQLNLIRSHSVGVGEPAAAGGRAADARAQGREPGTRCVRRAREVIDTLIAVHDAGLVPFVPSQGSVGASGDLAPLAHMTLALIGEGEMMIDGRARAGVDCAAQRWHRAARPSQRRKDWRSSTGRRRRLRIALHALLTFEPVLESALVIGAMTVDAARGSDGPFDPRIHALRGQPGQIDVAHYYRTLLAGSAIRRSHLTGDDRVQDPYSLRCQPQVVGACLDQLRHAALVLLREANGVTDNPLVFVERASWSRAATSMRSLSRWRATRWRSRSRKSARSPSVAIAMLIDAGVSRLPPFLAAEPGLNSGFMIAHVTAASLASENKSLAHPASVDSLPTSANQEDHVSMAAFAARRLLPMIENTSHILGIELLAAAQGIEFLRPMRSSTPVEAAHALLRAHCPPMLQDRYLAPDIGRATRLVRDGSLASILRRLDGLPALWIPA